LAERCIGGLGVRLAMRTITSTVRVQIEISSQAFIKIMLSDSSCPPNSNAPRKEKKNKNSSVRTGVFLS